MTTHQKQGCPPVLATTAQPLLQTTTKLTLNNVGEVFTSFHSAFNDYLKIKCFRKPSTTPDPRPRQTSALQLSRHPSFPCQKRPFPDKPAPCWTDELSTDSVCARWPAFPLLTLGTSLRTEQNFPWASFTYHHPTDFVMTAPSHFFS